MRVVLVITDHVRSTRGGYIFSLSVSSHLGGRGGTRGPPAGGSPPAGEGAPPAGKGACPLLGRGHPLPRRRGASLLGRGHPLLGKGGTPCWGAPPAKEGGCPPAGGGVPPLLGAPCQGGEGGAPPKQHSVYLLRGGRYASCIHAGGLSCFFLLLFIPVYFLQILVLQPACY